MYDSLSNVKVVEIGQEIAAPYACKLLSDLGADVIKVEPPGTGDALRSQGPNMFLNFCINPSLATHTYID